MESVHLAVVIAVKTLERCLCSAWVILANAGTIRGLSLYRLPGGDHTGRRSSHLATSWCVVLQYDGIRWNMRRNTVPTADNTHLWDGRNCMSQSYTESNLDTLYVELSIICLCGKMEEQAALADISPPLQAKRSSIIAPFIKYEPVFTKYVRRKSHFN